MDSLHLSIQPNASGRCADSPTMEFDMKTYDYAGELTTESGKIYRYRIAGDGNPTVKVYNEHSEYVIDLAISNNQTPEQVVNDILYSTMKGDDYAKE